MWTLRQILEYCEGKQLYTLLIGSATYSVDSIEEGED